MKISEVTGQLSPKVIPVIVCGGSGTRLWPVSREAFPKPFMRLADRESLLQKAYMRAREIPGVDEILIVTNRDTYFLVKDDCAEVRADGVRLGFVLEPVARNTAAAIAAAATVVRARHGGDVVLLVTPADQLVDDVKAFAQAAELAAHSASHQGIVVFGIEPTCPATGYGYIETEDRATSPKAVIAVKKFVEKPTHDVAEQFVASGRHLWNAGMFCFRPDTIIDELKAWVPSIYECVANAVEHASLSSSGEDYVVELDSTWFKRAEGVSIDYAVMERSTSVSVVPCSIGWSDIGSWKAVSDLTSPDADGNRVEGAATLYDVKDSYIRASGRVIGALGVRDLIIVDTPDALLVATRERAEDVKKIVAQLKENGNQSCCTLHRTVHRPWGTYTVLEEGDRFKMKRIVVKPGASLSLQMHHHRSEHWIVVQGCADVTTGDRVVQLQPNESTYIPAGHKHRLSNPGVLDLVLIEVQCGEYLGEDDIVRFEDVYGRLKATEASVQ